MTDSLKLSLVKESVRHIYGVSSNFYSALSNKKVIDDTDRKAQETKIIESLSDIEVNNLTDKEKKEYRDIRIFMIN